MNAWIGWALVHKWHRWLSQTTRASPCLEDLGIAPMVSVADDLAVGGTILCVAEKFAILAIQTGNVWRYSANYGRIYGPVFHPRLHGRWQRHPPEHYQQQ